MLVLDRWPCPMDEKVEESPTIYREEVAIVSNYLHVWSNIGAKCRSIGWARLVKWWVGDEFIIVMINRYYNAFSSRIEEAIFLAIMISPNPVILILCPNTSFLFSHWACLSFSLCVPFPTMARRIQKNAPLLWWLNCNKENSNFMQCPIGRQGSGNCLRVLLDFLSR